MIEQQTGITDSLSQKAPSQTQVRQKTPDISQSGLFWLLVLNSNALDEQGPGSIMTPDVTQQVFTFLNNNPGFSRILNAAAKTALSQARPKQFTHIQATANAVPHMGGDFNLASYTNAGDFDVRRALQIAATDNAKSGYCARGVANILKGMGYNCESADGHNWDTTLNRNDDFVFLKGATPENAPSGSVLVYNSDVQEGQRVRPTGGGKFGHVEVVAETTSGNRLYISDKARKNWGGTVPDNYVGAWMPKDLYEKMMQKQEAALASANNQNGQTTITPADYANQINTAPGEKSPETSTRTFNASADGPPLQTAPSGVANNTLKAAPANIPEMAV